MLDHQLLDHDALGLSDLVRSGEVTPEELLAVTVGRVERLDGMLKAVITSCPERALNHIKQKNPSTPFAGIPTFLKDLVDLEGVRRTDGSRSMMNNISAGSAAWVTAAEAAGLVMAGKTNTPEFASMTVTDNEAFGTTLNPWDLNLSAGGSSGGAAAAVAAGYTPIAHGTDGGGSNRIPASWCGVFGMKPSRKRLASGELDGSHPVFKTHLALSRTVRDNAALFLSTQNTSQGPQKNPYPLLDAFTPISNQPLRIAFTLEGPFGDQPDPAIRTALEDTVRLCESLGHQVTLVKHPVAGEELFSMYTRIFLSRTTGLIEMIEKASGLPIEESGLLTRCTIDFVRRGNVLPPGAAETAEADRLILEATMAKFFTNHDVWLTPVTPHLPTTSTDWLSSHPFDEQRTQRSMGSLPIANAIGGPAMSVPLWWDKNTDLPIGSHFSTKPGADETLYALAFQLEAAQPWADRWAPTSAKHL
ncbi:MAG: amidase [Acidimicrobiales bacterium]|nr:amidase [Acidimicrobiales bacterium]